MVNISPMRILIDTDPGIDDSVALALAVRSPELEIAAVTTVFGNTTVPRATRNAEELFARLGVRERISVYPGADRPLVRALQVATDTLEHGENGLGYAEAEFVVEPESPAIDAPLAMLRAVSTSQEPLTFICLGPLTNLAIALALDRPLLQSRLAEIVVMGGAPDGWGNITPVAEFNFWCDPEAAQIVLHSGIPIRLVGLNVTRRMVVTRRVVELLTADVRPHLRWWGEMLRFYEEFHRTTVGLEGCVINDPLAIALAMLPEWGVARAMQVDVSLNDDATRGQSVCDRHPTSELPSNASVYLDCQWNEVLQLVNDRVFDGAIPAEEIARGAAMEF